MAGNPNLGTLPPPDRGFMITKGRAGGGVSYSVIPVAGAALARAVRPATPATTMRASVTMTTQKSPETAYRIRTATGAATTKDPSTQRRAPLLVTNHHRAASAIESPSRPSRINAMLRSPA